MLAARRPSGRRPGFDSRGRLYVCAPLHKTADGSQTASLGKPSSSASAWRPADE